MPGLFVKPTRKGISDGALVVAVVGGIISILLSLAVLVAGTSTHSNKDGEGSHLFLKELAFVSFDGILANNDSSEFLVHLHLFANSFAWEYPEAPKGIPNVGIAAQGPSYTSNVVESLHKIARDLELQQDTWDCPKIGNYEDPCSNIFFEAWRSHQAVSGIPITGWMLWIMLLAAIALCTMTIAHEWMIQHRPCWMRCRCLIGKRWCPCPQGTKEEIEKLDDFTWDKVRLSFWAFTACYFALPALHATLTTTFRLLFLSYFEERLPEGISMHPRRNTEPGIMLWIACGSSTVSSLCMYVKWKLSRRPKGWAEELGRLYESEPVGGTNAQYTD